MASLSLLIISLAFMVVGATSFNPLSLLPNPLTNHDKPQDNVQRNTNNFRNEEDTHSSNIGREDIGNQNTGNRNYDKNNHPVYDSRETDRSKNIQPINNNNKLNNQRGYEENQDGVQNSRQNSNNVQTPNQDSSYSKSNNNWDKVESTTKQDEVTSKNIFVKIGKGIGKEIQDVKQPVLAGVVNVASSQCDNLKKIAGVAYEQLDGEDEPDVSQLTLRFISGSYNITYNITTAAREIPAARNHDPSQRLYIFLHGFTDDPTKTSYSTIRSALYNEGKCNVLGLDASSLIHWLYLRSTTYVQFIGEKLGEVLAALAHGGVHRSNIHIIGHSLGAHIAGFTGKQFLRLTGTRVGRISGLDPAGPCFAHVNESQRLNATDADFVDVIHTDSGVYGIKEPVGQVDYYPNEGKSQPGCFFETCSHSRAVQLFADSIQHPQSFPSVKCDSWDQFEKGQCTNEESYMGLASTPGTRGQFYLQTGSEAPFGRGLDGARYKDQKGVVKSITKLLG